MTRFATGIILIFLILIFLMGAIAVAQDSAPKVQVFGGYSLLHINTGGLTGGIVDLNLDEYPNTFQVRNNYKGWNAEAQYNFNSSFGIVADFDGRYGTPFTAPSGVSGLPSLSAYSILVGPVLTFKPRARLTPFVHVLVGGERNSLSASTIRGLPAPASSAGSTYTDGVLAAGGGLDLRLTRHFSIRLAQVDFFRTYLNLSTFYGDAFGPGTFEGLARREDNVRVSAGIVVRF